MPGQKGVDISASSLGGCLLGNAGGQSWEEYLDRIGTFPQPHSTCSFMIWGHICVPAGLLLFFN